MECLPLKSEFFKRVAQVLLGTMGAQLISLGVMLLLVRLYTPAELGLYNVWFSFATIMAVVVTGRYELALFSGARDSSPQTVVKLIVVVALAASVLMTACLVVASYVSRSVPGVVAEYVYALALLVFGLGINKLCLSVLALQQAFRRLGYFKMAVALSIAIAQVVAGLFEIGVPGLIYGQVAGVFLAVVIAAKWFDRHWLRECSEASFDQLKASARHFSNFPKYSLPSDLINTVSSQLPMILLASRFGAETAGWFGLTIKMMGAPITLLASSVLDVFKEQAARDYRTTGTCLPIFTRTAALLAALSLPPFVAFWFLGEWAFGAVFGAEWTESGRYAVLMIPLFYLRFVVSPLSYTIYIAEKQKLDLLWQTVLLIFTVSTFYWSDSASAAIKVYSIGYAAMYVIYFLISRYCAKGVTA